MAEEEKPTYLEMLKIAGIKLEIQKYLFIEVTFALKKMKKNK